MITVDQIKELRDRTSVSVAKCKKALEEAGGDMNKALEILQKEGAIGAQKRADRALGAGVVEAYIHSNKQVGVLLELKSESDFVARNPEFQNLAHSVAMHIAACDPKDAKELMEQPYVKNPNLMVKDYIREAIQKFGENIDVARFTRFSLS